MRLVRAGGSWWRLAHVVQGWWRLRRVVRPFPAVPGPGWGDGRLSQPEAVELQPAEDLQGLGVEAARTVMGTQHGGNGAQRCGAHGAQAEQLQALGCGAQSAGRPAWS